MLCDICPERMALIVLTLSLSLSLSLSCSLYLSLSLSLLAGPPDLLEILNRNHGELINSLPLNFSKFSNNIHTFIMGLDLVEDVEKDFLQKLS